MHARSTTIAGDPQLLGPGTDYVRDEALPMAREADGCVGLSMLADRTTGRCIVTTSWRDEEAIRASRAGIAAFRDGTAGALGGEPVVEEWEIAAMHRVRAGELVIDPSMTSGTAIITRFDAQLYWPGGRLGLTRRESEVLALIVTGLTNRAIAERLVLGDETVKTHVRAIYRKLGVHDRESAHARALREGLFH